jgi:hypothetical protein
MFAMQQVPHTFRVTHYQDTVPHLPPQVLGFHHLCTEVYEDQTGALRTCTDPSCEDPTCADQFSPKEFNGDDHMTYLGLPIGCESVSL